MRVSFLEKTVLNELKNHRYRLIKNTIEKQLIQNRAEMLTRYYRGTKYEIPPVNVLPSFYGKYIDFYI